MKKAVLSLFLIAFLFGCLSIEPTCRSPYTEYQKGSCCLDANSNNICDTDETSTTTTTTTSTTTTTTTIVIIYSINDDGYIRCGPGSCRPGAPTIRFTNDMLWFGEYDETHFERAYIEFDVSSIQDSGWSVDSVKIWLDVHDAADTPCDITALSHRPTTSGDTEIYVDIGNGISYVYNNDFCQSSGEKVLDLGPQGQNNLANSLTSDWFAVGLKITDEKYISVTEPKANIWSNESSNPPRLIVKLSRKS